MNGRKIGLSFLALFAVILLAFATIAAQSTKPAPKPGTVLAGVWGKCASIDDPTGSFIRRSFNNVNDNPITITDGIPKGYCTIDFGFDISERYIIVTAAHPDTPLGASISAPPFLSGTSVKIYTWHALADSPVSGAVNWLRKIGHEKRPK